MSFPPAAPAQQPQPLQPRPKILDFITGNANKLAEVRAILGDVPGLDLQSRNVDGFEIQGTIEEIARDKASRAASAVNGPVLTEDTALEFQALKGLPGPYIKYFLQALGHDGLNKMLAAYEDKTAFAAGVRERSFRPGGRLSLVSRAGWDAVFEFEDGQTYAEMEKEKKNLISHRGKALAKLKAWLAGGELEP
ncbi:hypothetical protein AYO22_09422 [Fonsecaea multimorphosa]|nr:hypothetical protein AYO22_09422 [Fonsecaea multimorphosa]